MPLAETQFLVAIAAALVVLGVQFFRMEDSKQKEIDDDLSKTYRDLRNKVLDPILQDIISDKKGNIDPEKFFATPDITGKLSNYKHHLSRYNKANSMQIAILKMLQFSANTLLVLGISIFILTGINELVVSPNIETIQISTFQIFTFELIILLIGLVFLGSFLYNYRNLNKEFREAINEIKGWTE